MMPLRWRSRVFTYMLLKIIVYNAQNTARERLDEISGECFNMDIVVVIGTGLHAKKDEEQTAVSKKLRHHHVVQWGWRQTALSNKSCGLAVMLKEELYNTTYKVFVPPPKLQIPGRVGAILFGPAKARVLVCPMYLPHRGAPRGERKRTSMRATEWL